MSGLDFETASSYVSTLANLYMNEQNNKENMRRQQQQQNYNLRLWQMNNAYNTPVEQRKRLEMAGFNPNLIAGQGSNFAGVSSGPAQGVNPIPSVASSIDTRAIMEADLISKQKELLEQQKRKTIYEADGIDIDNQLRFEKNLKDLHLTDETIKNISAQTHKVWNEIDLIQQQVKNLSLEQQKLEQEINSIIANIDLTKAKTLTEQQLLAVYAAQELGLQIDNSFKSEHWQAQINKLNADAKNAVAQAAQAYAGAEKLKADTEFVEFNTMKENQLFQYSEQLAQESVKQSKTETARQEFNLKMDKKFAAAERRQKVITGYVGSVTGLVSALKPGVSVTETSSTTSTTTHDKYGRAHENVSTTHTKSSNRRK